MNIPKSKIIPTAFLIFTVIISLIGGLTLLGESNTATVPAYEAVDISRLAEQSSFSPAEADLLWEQTGLNPKILDTIEDKEERKAVLLAAQKQLFTPAEYHCDGLALFSKAELFTDPQSTVPLYDLRPGDVLITKSTHTLCYRHGHSALYLGEGKLLEAAAIGLPTAITDAAYWGKYPSGLHLRLKESAAAKIHSDAAHIGAEAAAYAEKELQNDDYHLLAGAFGIGTATDQTQCAHLIYTAYAHCGIKTAAREFPVTPHALWESGQFEVLHCWGFDPTDIDRSPRHNAIK